MDLDFGDILKMPFGRDLLGEKLQEFIRGIQWGHFEMKWSEGILDRKFKELAARRSKCWVMVYGLEYGLIAHRDCSIIAAAQCAARGLLPITLPMQFLVI